MKKLLLTLGVVAAASVSFGQGLISFDTLGGVQKTNTSISTFAGSFPGATGYNTGVSGSTASTANGFYYTLLIAATSQGANPAAAGWTQAQFGGAGGGLMATNISGITGDAQGPKGTQSTVIDNWAGGATMSFMIVGWSANLGTSWSTVLGELNAQWANIPGYSATTPYYFGTSAIGSGASGVPPTGTALNTWATAGTFSMSQVGPVPEPATMVLAGLGGLSLLALRRKK